MKEINIDSEELIKLYESVGIQKDKILILTKYDIQRGRDRLIEQQRKYKRNKNK